MISPHLRRCVSAVFVFILLVALSAPIIYGAECPNFSLSGAEVKKNRVCTLTLSSIGEEKVSAFVAELIYDPEMLEYSGASVLDSGAYHSINSIEAGKLTAVYFCKAGVDCADGAELMSFEFKGLNAGDAKIALTVTDVINSDAEEVAVGNCTCAVITVVSAPNAEEDEETESAEDSDSTQTDSDAADYADTVEPSKGGTAVDSVPVNTQTVLAVILAVICMLCVVGFTAYKLGAKIQKEKDDPAVPVLRSKETGDSKKSGRSKNKERYTDEENT